MKSLVRKLTENNCDAYVSYDSFRNADMRYLAGFSAYDPYFYVFKNDGNSYIIVSSMEELRARRESSCNVLTRSALNLNSLLQEFDAETASAKMIANFAGERILVPSSMPVGFAKALEKFAEVVVDDGTVEKIRSIKTADEIDKIKHAQEINEIVLDKVIGIIKNSVSDNLGALFLENGEPLTSEYLKEVTHSAYRHYGFDDEDIIISCGKDTALPHAKGSGQFYANEPIVLDFFPRDLKMGYFSDMTRTVSKGKPSEEIVKIYNTVHEAKELAVSMIRPGISGADVHNAVVDFFKGRGYETAGNSGFIHSLGHGVGLEIHEAPSLSVFGKELKEGHVVTVEPGLYYPGIGGVRLEDMGVVTKDGFERFTKFEERLVL
ncbi:MAG: Xaa-Pro peptidase family protein [Methanocorpusculum sp.]|nr:Xaa-Pro peptidase family protein [Methanocorpusculum sp.]